MPARIFWTQEMTEGLVRARDIEGKTFSEIGDLMGLGESTVYERYRTFKRQQSGVNSETSIEKLREQIPTDDRDLTGRVFGDPPSQRSALYMRDHGGRP